MKSILLAYSLLVPALLLARGDEATSATPSSPAVQHQMYLVEGNSLTYVGQGDHLQFTNNGTDSKWLGFHDLNSGALIATHTALPGQTQLFPILRDTKIREHTAGDSDDIDGICIVDCLPAGTSVRTEAGSVPIERVASSALLAGGPRPQSLLDVRRARADRLIELRFEGTAVRATRGHLFLTAERGWQTASQLRAGEVLVTAGEGRAVLTSVETVQLSEPVPVYNLILDGEGQYLVGELGLVSTDRAPALR